MSGVEVEASQVDESDHSEIDFGFSDDLQRMSAAALSALESITDEVDAMEKKGKANKPKVERPSLGDHFKAAEKKKSSPVTPSPRQDSSSIKHIDDVELSDDEGGNDDDMSYDMSLDGSIANELDALRVVAQEIEKELQTQDGQTMEKAIESLEKNADDPKKRMLTSDDKEIIRKALVDEMKKYEPKNAWERFMKRYQLEGLSEQDRTYALATLCTLVWSIVLRLLFKVKYGEI